MLTSRSDATRFCGHFFAGPKSACVRGDTGRDVKRSVNAIAKAILVLPRKNRVGPSADLARGMLGEDGTCAVTKVLDEENIARLREVIASANHN